MTDTLIPDKAASTAELDRLELRTQLFIDGRFRDAVGGDAVHDREPGDRTPDRGGRPGRRRPTWTPRSRPRVGPPTTAAGPG